MRFIIILLATLSTPAVCEIYKWTDENGVTHFGSQPPPGQQETVDIKPASGPGAEPGEAPESLIIKQAQMLEAKLLEEERARAQQNEARILESFTRATHPAESESCQKAKIILQGYKDDLRTLLKRGYKQSERNRAEDRVRRWQNEVAYYCS